MLEERVEQYLAQCERRLRPATTQTRRYALRQFLGYLESIGMTRWDQCTRNILRNYISYRAQEVPDGGVRPLSPESLKSHLTTIRLFLDFAVKMGDLSHNPAVFVTAPKGKKRLPNTLDVDLVQRILNTPPKTEHEVRDLATCELFYSTGMRLAELAALNLSDIDFGEAEVHIRDGKGGKARYVPIGSKAIEALQRWLPLREEWLHNARALDQEALFITTRGNRISTRQISNRVKLFAQSAGVNVNIHPHLLRHSMATHVLESSQDIRFVQELLGHADISTTQIYTNLDFNHLASVYERAHPRARKEGEKRDDESE